MKRIRKFGLELIAKQTLELPEESKILSVHEQIVEENENLNGLFLFALINSENETDEKFEIAILGTGTNIPDIDDYTFINSFGYHDKDLMFHAFYKKLS